VLVGGLLGGELCDLLGAGGHAGRRIFVPLGRFAGNEREHNQKCLHQIYSAKRRIMQPRTNITPMNMGSLLGLN
jgi:hypothetical protein